MTNKIVMLPALALLLATAGCGDRNDVDAASEGMNQTKFPGMVTSGGNTSGEVLARAKSAVGDGNPSGTPGIPEGSGGNTSGAAMGGTTGGAAATKADETVQQTRSSGGTTSAGAETAPTGSAGAAPSPSTAAPPAAPAASTPAPAAPAAGK